MDWSKASAELARKLDPAHVKGRKQGSGQVQYIEAFESHVHYEPNSGCWLWDGADNGSGYGKFRGRYAHRVSFEMHKGPIPQGMHLDHLCRVPCCVNPSHLEPVTNAENARRGRAGWHMKDGAAPIGELHPRSVATEQSVREIRAKYQSGSSQFELSGEYGLSQPTISQIVRRKTWRHV